MADLQTLDVYDARAADYAQSFGMDHGKDPSLRDFIAALPKRARVLDLGCGPGSWAVAMAQAGLSVDAVDASAGMVEQAQQHQGITVWQARFDQIEAEAIYDGIWANFSLLHAPRDEMPGHLARLKRALKPGGLLHIGLKQGQGEARDSLGRFYTYYTVPELTGLLRAIGLEPTAIRHGADKGLDGTVAPWFTLTAHD
ncbi:class I SAM-dependent methyltransferase [Tropicibacter naphthalenivorans]|uniref:Mg-protoporphyrin IX methyl transferase n=1 Tax=Tropicibacter naphthalenivorans TaxID=441103 RepID=A0A0N7LZQ9_9RHOB|nr:class I SAM-dependent methyltransferase [Tropicibacter naphthalenivorans]CUH78353.1 Mg-protoporphyrin IX methyl transferase [Tropicibacter naphthalenivorans]SMC79878.1 Methyltransferase domain-containing protein [Tropicibacter naphthalenivorans]